MAIREKLRLGDVLIQAGAINQDQLGKALAYQKQNGGQLGEILIKMRFISEERGNQRNSYSSSFNWTFGFKYTTYE